MNLIVVNIHVIQSMTAKSIEKSYKRFSIPNNKGTETFLVFNIRL